MQESSDFRFPWHTPPGLLLRAAFESLRNHRNREDLVEPLIVRNAVKRLLIRAAKRDGDEVDRRRDRAEVLPVRRKDLDSAHSAAGRGVNTALRVDGGAV